MAVPSNGIPLDAVRARPSGSRPTNSHASSATPHTSRLRAKPPRTTATSLDPDIDRASEPAQERWELYRVLSEPMRLRLLALAAEEELAVGEFAELLREAQPNISRHVTPLRQAGLVRVRKQGTRVLIRAARRTLTDPVVADALAAGRKLCGDDGSLARVADIVHARDVAGRASFAHALNATSTFSVVPNEFRSYFSAIAPLIPHRRVAVDAGTGDGAFLELLAPLFTNVVAFDREEAQLARCEQRIAKRGDTNVALLNGGVDSKVVLDAVRERGGADVVFAVRFLHHAPKPAECIRALASLLRPGGALIVVDYAQHNDESLRDEGDLWLGFSPGELRRFSRDADLQEVVVEPFALPISNGNHADAQLPWQLMIAKSKDESKKHVQKFRKQ